MPSPKSASFCFAGFVLDAGRWELRKGAQHIELQPKVLRLLQYLLENAERAVSKEELLDALWPGTTVGEGSLTTAVGLTRRALGEHGGSGQIVRTVHGVGYRIDVPVERLEGVSTHRTRPGVARVHDFSRFVGREDEMETLELAFQRAIEGNGRVVGVVGEAGVGKSRLCLEFAERCRARGILALEAHCRSYGRTVPLLPILELLRASFEIAAADSDQRAREKVASRLLRLDEDFRDKLPLVFDFLGVADPQRPPALMDPGARRQEISDFLKRLVAARSRREPAVLLVDDLHWIDAGSDALLAQLVEAVDGTRTLLLVNFRPDYRAEWFRKSYCQQLPLWPLNAQGVSDLLGVLLGDDPSVAHLPDLIREQTGGNPFFIEEVVQSLIEAQQLAGTSGAYRVVGSLERLAVPTAVEPLLAARIDRLPELEKQLLQTASAIGRKFAQEILRSVADLPEAEVAAALNRLRTSEFLREDALFPEREYAFKHPLTREVAEQSLPEGRREQVHATVARVLEVQHAETLDEQAAVLAYHWEQAGEVLQAANWHRRAAEWVAGRAPYEALRHWRRVRALAGTEQHSSSAAKLVLTACGETLRLAWQTAPSAEELTAAYEEGKRLAERSGDVRSLALLVHGYAVVRGHAGDVREWHTLALEAADLAEETNDPSIRILTQQDVAHTHYLLGRLLEALSLVDRNLERSRREPQLLEDPRGALGFGVLLWLKGFVLTFLGRLEEARNEISQLVSLARAHDLHVVLFRALAASALLSSFRGDKSETLAQAQEAWDIAERLGPLQRAEAHHFLGMAQIQNEAHTTATQELERSLAISRDSETYLPMEAQILADLADAYLGCDQARRAQEIATDAIGLARHRGTRLFECKAHLSLTRALLKVEGAGGAKPISAALESARQLAREIGTPPYEAQFHEESAHLAHLLGDVRASGRELRKAHRLFTEMGATGHAERLTRELEI